MSLTTVATMMHSGSASFFALADACMQRLCARIRAYCDLSGQLLLCERNRHGKRFAAFGLLDVTKWNVTEDDTDSWLTSQTGKTKKKSSKGQSRPKRFCFLCSKVCTPSI